MKEWEHSLDLNNEEKEKEKVDNVKTTLILFIYKATCPLFIR